jgi:hypothetical protein
VIVSAVGLVLVHERGWLRRVGLAAALAAAAVSVNIGALDVIRAYRDSVVDAAGTTLPARHPLWHSIYIGLGYLPNDLGLAWKDEVATAKVESLAPNVRFLSPKYEELLREEVVEIVRSRPGFVADTVASKLAETLRKLLTHMTVPLILAVLAAAFARRSLRRESLIALPAVAIGFVPPLLTMPWISYMMTLLGGVAFLGLLAVGWLATEKPWRDARQRLRQVDGMGLTVLTALGVVVAFAIIYPLV